MNGIPTTFNDGLPSYTVVGGARCGRSGISVVLLSCRELVDRERLYRSLRQAGFEQILSIEANYTEESGIKEKGTEEQYIEEQDIEEDGEKNGATGLFPDIGQLSAAYPFVRFVLLSKPLPAGSQINLAATELQEDAFLVLRKYCVLDPVRAETIIEAAFGETNI